jgi:hypothetical protein
VCREREGKVGWMETIEEHKTRTMATDSHRQSTVTCLQRIRQGGTLETVKLIVAISEG